jgi:hypothetical protein
MLRWQLATELALASQDLAQGLGLHWQPAMRLSMRPSVNSQPPGTQAVVQPAMQPALLVPQCRPAGVHQAWQLVLQAGCPRLAL